MSKLNCVVNPLPAGVISPSELDTLWKSLSLLSWLKQSTLSPLLSCVVCVPLGNEMLSCPSTSSLG